MEEQRFVSGRRRSEDEPVEETLRPQRLEEYTRQERGNEPRAI